ncbi:MAG TPA: rhomboid family intramembrane serine protease [Coxiellaceae bacterium]|nr:rhomboid family intramembrane serine protease [Coxiellaceae bacterium]
MGAVMFKGFATSLQEFVTVLKMHGPTVLGYVAIAWLIHFINICCGYRLNILGIYPRRMFGLVGVVCSPWLHGSWGHLFLNSVMFILMAMMLLTQGLSVFIGVTVCIVVLSGLLVWLFAREALHIGASALIMGYWGYLLVVAYHHPTALNIIVSLVCLYYFGGMAANLLPTDRRVSWEGHACGFISGIVVCFLYPWLHGHLLG